MVDPPNGSIIPAPVLNFNNPTIKVGIPVALSHQAFKLNLR